MINKTKLKRTPSYFIVLLFTTIGLCLFVRDLFIGAHNGRRSLFFQVVNADTIIQTNSFLSVKVETFSENIIVSNANSHLIRLNNGDERILITCSKITSTETGGPLLNGTILAYVNTKSAEPIRCLSYLGDESSSSSFNFSDIRKEYDENLCLSKQFSFHLKSDRSSFIEISCSLIHSFNKVETSKIYLTRLYEDSTPRIRSGLILDSFGAIVIHYINLERVSCEAVREINTFLPYSSSSSLNDSSLKNPLILPKPEKFNAIQWYNADRTQLLSVKFSTIQLNSNLINYTSLFPYDETQNDTNLVKENSHYQCCTVLNGDIVNCQTFLAQIYNPSPYLTQSSTILNSNFVNGLQKIQEIDVSLEEKNTTNIYQNFSLNLDEHKGKFFNLTSNDAVSQQDQLKMSTNVILGQQINNNQQTSPQATTYPSNLSNSEIGIIIASIAGFIMFLMFLLLILLCYKRHQYGLKNKNILYKDPTRPNKTRLIKSNLTKKYSDEIPSLDRNLRDNITYGVDNLNFNRLPEPDYDDDLNSIYDMNKRFYNPLKANRESRINENVDLSIYQEIKPNNKNIETAKKKKSLSRKISDRVIRVFVTNPDSDDDENDERRSKQKSSRNNQRLPNPNVNYRKKTFSDHREQTSSVKPPHYPRETYRRRNEDEESNVDFEDQNEYYTHRPSNNGVNSTSRKSTGMKDMHRFSKTNRVEENDDDGINEFSRNKNTSRIDVTHVEPGHRHSSISHDIENRFSSTKNQQDLSPRNSSINNNQHNSLQNRYLDEEDENIYQSHIKPQHSFVPPPPILPPAIPFQPPPSKSSTSSQHHRLSNKSSTIPFPPPPPLPQSFLNAHTQVSPAATFSLASQTDKNYDDDRSESSIMYAVQPQSSVNSASIRHHSVISVSKNELNGNGHMPTIPPPPPLYEEENEEANKNIEHMVNNHNHHRNLSSSNTNNLAENDNFLDVVYVDGSGTEIHKQTNVLY